MTVERFQKPLAIAFGLFLLALLMEYAMPPFLSDVVAAFLRFVICVLLIRLVYRLYELEPRQDRFEKEVLDVVRKGQQHRDADLIVMKRQTEQIAEALRIETVRSAEIAADELKAQTTTLMSKIQEGTDASKAAQHEANNAKEKLEEVNLHLSRVVPPRGQLDDIQETSHKTHDIAEALEKKIETKP